MGEIVWKRCQYPGIRDGYVRGNDVFQIAKEGGTAGTFWSCWCDICGEDADERIPAEKFRKKKGAKNAMEEHLKEHHKDLIP